MVRTYAGVHLQELFPKRDGKGEDSLAYRDLKNWI